LSTKSEKHLAALDYVERGWAIIPILPGAKRPLRDDWRNAKLNTAEDVDTLYASGLDYNLAFEPEDMGLAVVDADLYHEGCDYAAENLPETYEVETPRGGTHFYFAGSVPSTVGNPDKRKEGRLGDYIDTRGRGGYVLLPPSEIIGKGAGKYAIKENRKFAALPLEVEVRLAPRNNAASVGAEVEPDLPGNIARAVSRLRDLVSRGTVARIGHYGHDVCYEVAVELVRDLGIAPGTALALMLEHWYPHCTPNDQPDFVRERVESCVTSGQNAIGVNATAPAAETFAGFNLPAVATSEPAPRSPYYALGTVDQLDLPDPEWLVKDVLPARQIVLLSATKGQFKTFLALDLALAVATGKASFGVLPEHTGLVFYGDHESMEGIAKFHRPAWHSANNLGPRDETGFYLMAGPRIAREEEQQLWEAEINYRQNIEKRPVRLIILDTYSKCMAGLDENDPNDAQKFIDFCKKLIDKYGCTILVLAHLGKDATRGTRGSSALPYGVDSLLRVERHKKTLSVKLFVDNHRSAPERATPFSFEGRVMERSIVFRLLGAPEVAALAEEHDDFDPRKVVGALRALGAVDDEHRVMTRPVAMALSPPHEKEGDERYEARVAHTDMRLRRLSRTTLKGLCFGAGQKLMWTLPPEVLE
jgi:hypothetical protein